MSFAKIDPAFKARWCADLRASAHLQGRGVLSRNGKFCCLGRLCVIDNVPISAVDDLTQTTVFAFQLYDGSEHDDIVPVGYRGLESTAIADLIGLNDAGIPFPEIAEWIETNL